MNHTVMTIYRLTESPELTFVLAYKLFANEKLSMFLKDDSGMNMQHMCIQLKAFMKAHLPRISLAMD